VRVYDSNDSGKRLSKYKIFTSVINNNMTTMPASFMFTLYQIVWQATGKSDVAVKILSTLFKTIKDSIYFQHYHKRNKQ